jgi:hypothetical protein
VVFAVGVDVLDAMGVVDQGRQRADEVLARAEDAQLGRPVLAVGQMVQSVMPTARSRSDFPPPYSISSTGW